MNKLQLIFAIIFPIFTCFAQSKDNEASALDKLDKINVVYPTPSEKSLGSMPLGNGDIGLNVWAESSGDVVMYLSKTDAWSENVSGNEGLLKLGRIRLHFSENPFLLSKDFKQELVLRKGKINIVFPEQTVEIWADANAPVVHIETTGKKAGNLQVYFESLRSDAAMALKDSLQFSKLHNDNIIAGNKDKIVWLYENQNKKIPELLNLKFGAMIMGQGLVNENDQSLHSSQARNKFLVNIYAFTSQLPETKDWLASIDSIAKKHAATPIEKARSEHEAWWKQFWLRSWIFLDGTEEAVDVTRAYTLQRFKNACAGRGYNPIKFNGSIFTMDLDSVWKSPKSGPGRWVKVNGDWREWGGRYWFQNTRHLYWPMFASGDYDMMMPFFNMYARQAPKYKESVMKEFGVNGVVFGECQPFWGGVTVNNHLKPFYFNHYYCEVLEYSLMGLRYFEETKDKDFFVKTLLPIASDGVDFYANRYQIDSITGKLVFYPCNAMETYWAAKNPAGDIAGFRLVLEKLLALPTSFTTEESRNKWKKYLAIAPEIPMREKDGKKIIIACQDTTVRRHNWENTDLCPVFPFHKYGLGLPNLDLAINTFKNRENVVKGCWHWDVTFAALLGLTEDAKSELVTICTVKDPVGKHDWGLRFPAFWGRGHDYWPDEDQGGVLMTALQFMLLQSDGKELNLLPTWPKEWNVNFKLHTSQKTTVWCNYQSGKPLSVQLSDGATLKTKSDFK